MTLRVWIDAGAERDPDPVPGRLTLLGTAPPVAPHLQGFVLRSTIEDALQEGDREREAAQARARRAKAKARSESAKAAWANRYVQA